MDDGRLPPMRPEALQKYNERVAALANLRRETTAGDAVVSRGRAGWQRLKESR
jgi:hypothetical protein